MNKTKKYPVERKEKKTVHSNICDLRIANQNIGNLHPDISREVNVKNTVYLY